MTGPAHVPGRGPDPVPGLPPLLEAVLRVGTDLELRATLQRIVDAAAELTGARSAALGTTDPGRDGLVRIRTTVHDRPSAPGTAAEGDGEGPGHDAGDRHEHGDDRDGEGTSTTTTGDGDSDSDSEGHGDSTGPGDSRGGTGTATGAGAEAEAGTGTEADTDPHPAPDLCLDVPIRVGDEVFGNLYLADRSGGPFTSEDEQVVRLLATQAGIAIANARLYETARQRERWIEGAAAVTTALLTRESADDALLTVAERARLLAGAAAGVILQPTPEGGMEIVAASTHEDPDGIVGTTIAPGSPVLEQLLGGESVFIDDSATDPRMTTPVRSRFGPSMMLPLETEGRLIGTLALPRARGDRPYTRVERLLATQFASQAALALVLAGARHSRERLAVYEDRDRIARDLHDLVVQRLFATGMMLESTLRRSRAEGTGGATDAAGASKPGDGGGAEVRATLGHAVDELQSTIQEVRTAIFALQQPPADAPTTFRGKVLRETAGAGALLGFQPSVRFTGPVEDRIPESVAGHLVAALRRALAVASRRTGVSRIEVDVDATAALPDGRPAVRLTVRDDSPAAGGGPDSPFTWQSPL
ncbi:GAF domain-containing protein [Streptomyces sp. NBC_00340]|uniref:GAF domain-containing protein n=1 Tax=Streptomyces sp. NBC_00340 TaxID=2975716 RepID=UPI0022594851|nr:GAF domain-containing protein [Streptomyces sp. NBC_00340]MCX5133330.1 GAF domain-containing protein [Streptomyces sp. NBC_00340]